MQNVIELCTHYAMEKISKHALDIIIIRTYLFSVNCNMIILNAENEGKMWLLVNFFLSGWHY